jgi:hypothetical protein
VSAGERVLAVDSRTLATHWKSPKLQSEVERVAVCDQRFFAQTQAGRVAVFEWVEGGRPRVLDRGRFELGAGVLHGVFGGCAKLAYATFDDKLLTFDVLLGRAAQVVRGASYALFDSRASEHGFIFVSGAEGLRLHDLNADQALRSQIAVRGPEGRLMQAHVIGPERILTEHCTTERACVVRLVEQSGHPRVQHRFDGSGSSARLDVASRIAFSTDARYFTWHRDGLALLLVETETGRRAELEVNARSAVAFSPYASGTFAVSTGEHVTVYEIR